MKLPRIMIAAAKSGSGKTLLTCALLQALKDRGIVPSAFKCGPDYIDPMFHRKVIGVPSRNLDTFFSDQEPLQALFLREKSEFSIIEGVMGLYDGLGGIREEGSAYHLAACLRTPILLVLDAHGMGRSLLPMIAGFLHYDTEHLIAGVILNRVTKGFYETIKPVLEAELSVPVFGYFPEQREIRLESRHLGLKMPEEIAELKEQVKKAAVVLEETVSIDRILETAERAQALNAGKFMVKKVTDSIKIGIARDAAFCFYYEDNLWMLRQAGAELIPFSPLHDRELPEGIAGILLGGGYPELYAKQLAENKSMKQAIREAIAGGMPSIAECGGFMYLHEKLVEQDGAEYQMCGVIPGICRNAGKLVRFGYLELQEKKPHFLSAQQIIKGHEFHYYDSSANGTDCIAVKPVSQKNWECVHAQGNFWWGYPHLYYPSSPNYVTHFLERAVAYEKRTSSCFD